MTITIDSRVGSRDLIQYMPKKIARLGILKYGDAAFLGNGPDGAPVTVGMELKRLLDLLNSMTTGRFAGHQLPGMQATYQVRYLIVEGIWRANPKSGLLERPRGKAWVPVELGNQRFMTKTLEAYICTQEIIGGMHIRTTGTPRQTAQLMLNLYYWWTHKDWEEHRSHLSFDESGGLPVALLTKPGLLRRMAKELTGIGWKRSLDVEQHFDSVRDMVEADEEEWMTIAGIDKGIAPKVVQEINEKRREK